MSIVERERQAEEVQGPITEREHRARSLEAAALELEFRGWAQDKMREANGSVCVVGAMLYALGTPPNVGTVTAPYGTHRALDALWGEVPSDLDASWIGAMGSNDRAAHADEVTFLLRWRASEIRDGR